MEFRDYAYKMKSPFDLEGIRQFIKLNHVYKVIEDMKNPKMLDIGCGYAEIYDFLEANDFSFTYTALDLNRKFANRNINFVGINLVGSDRLPFPDSVFDVVLLLDTLQNISHSCGENTISQASRILKKGGKLCISTRNALIEPETDATNHVYRWDIIDLLAELSENSMEVKQIYGINYGWNEEDALAKGDGILKNFLPSRFYRAIAGLDKWEKCKYVMIDCEKANG